MSKKQYKVLYRIWHTKDLRNYDPGAVVSLDHLDDEKIQRLVDTNTVEEVKQRRKSEVKQDGTNN